jgi:hypothetical protein
MTEDLPSFDPDHETPATAPKPPKKPRQKPTKKRKARAPVVTHPQPKKKRGKKRAGISKKPDRRTKAFRRAARVAQFHAESSEMSKSRTKSVEGLESMTQFIENVLGIKVQPWQARALEAVLEEKK